MPGSASIQPVVISYIVQIGQAVGPLRTMNSEVRRTGDVAGRTMGKAGQSMTTLAKLSSMAGPLIAVGVGGALAVSAKAAIDFESSFAGVRKTVDASEGQFQQLAMEMRELSKEIPVNVNELNKLAEVGGQLGIRAENLSSFTRTIAEIGVATPLAADQAALSLARLSNILGVSQDQIFRIGSSLVELGNNFATTEDQIINFALRIAPVGETVGLTADQVLALSAAFSAVGVPAERGGTAVQRVFIRMEEAVLSGGDKLQKFADIAGVSAAEFADAYENNAARAFQMFIEGLGNIQDAGGNVFEVLRDVGLANERSVQSMLAAAGGATQLADALRMSEEAWKDGNAATEEAEKRFMTTAGQAALLRNKTNDLAIAIGERLRGSIVLFLDSLGEVTDRTTDLVQAGDEVEDRWTEVFLNLQAYGLQFIDLLGVMWPGNWWGDNAFWSGERNALDRQVELLKIMASHAGDFGASAEHIPDLLMEIAESDLARSELPDALRKISLYYNVTTSELRDMAREQIKANEGNEGAIAVWEVILSLIGKTNVEISRFQGISPRAAKGMRGFGSQAHFTNVILSELKWNMTEINSGLRSFIDTQAQSQGNANAFLQTMRDLADAQAAYNEETSEENLQGLVDATLAAKEAFAGLGDDGIAPAIELYREMYRRGEITNEVFEEQVGLLYAATNAFSALLGTSINAGESFDQLVAAAAEFNIDVGTLIARIFDLDAAMAASIRTAGAFALAMRLAFFEISESEISEKRWRQLMIAAGEAGVAEAGLELRSKVAEMWETLGELGADALGRGVSGGSDEVVKTFQELAIEASRKFMDGIRMTLNRGAMERALAGARQGLADALEELDELPAKIRQTMRELRAAQREAERITTEEEADILRGRLDVMRGERELYELRRERMDLPRLMAEAQQELTDAQEAYNEALLEANRLEREHTANLTDLQAELFRVQRAYGMGEASFQDMIDAEINLAEELAKSGDATQLVEDAQKDLADTQREVAEELDDLRYRQKEIALELQLAELELALARKDLTQKMKDAIGPTQEVLKLEEELNELRERAAELRKQIPDLEDAVILAELDLIAAHLDLIAAGEDLLAMEPQYRAFFESLAAAAGLANGAFRGVGAPAVNTVSVSRTEDTPSTPQGYTKIGDNYKSIYSGTVYTPDDLRRQGVIAHQGAFIDAPKSREFPILARGQEVIMPIDSMSQAITDGVSRAIRESAGGSGQTIVVQLGDREVARFVADEVLAEGARRMRVARRVS